jgi:prepilin-type N-terminal cleavage/methylation domain-containing protein/prepilin-type processing-associated H-X9-DG protein
VNNLAHKIIFRAHEARSRAFTLVELLVVSAIIAIIAALLLPSLHQGGVAAQRVRCASNLHQFGLAAQMYWDENAGRCFRFGGIPLKNGTDDGKLYWFGWIGNGAEGQRPFDATQGALYPYVQGRGIEVCPSLNYFSAQFKLKAAGAAYGYGYNFHLSAGFNKPPLSISAITRPTDTVFMADAAQVNTFEAPASLTHPMLEEWYYVDESANMPNGHFRHRNFANVLFCDGHIGREKMVPGSLDQHLPSANVGRLRTEILVVQ